MSQKGGREEGLKKEKEGEIRGRERVSKREWYGGVKRISRTRTSTTAAFMCSG